MNIEPYTVYLIYNCYYMREVCRNAEIFGFSARGQNLHPRSGLANDVFGYDLDTGDRPSQTPRSHQDLRRTASCPDSWSSTHLCPEAGQRKPMRHNGEWFTTDLEPNTHTNNLRNQRDSNNNIIRYSNIRYTCDEFPPATWYVTFIALVACSSKFEKMGRDTERDTERGYQLEVCYRRSIQLT